MWVENNAALPRKIPCFGIILIMAIRVVMSSLIRKENEIDSFIMKKETYQ
jgi:hypothetical protein